MLKTQSTKSKRFISAVLIITMALALTAALSPQVFAAPAQANIAPVSGATPSADGAAPVKAVTEAAPYTGTGRSTPAILSGVRPSLSLSAKTYQIQLYTGGTPVAQSNISYLVSNPNIATVNKNTGAIKLLRVGSTMIRVTVKYPDNSTWTGTVNLVIQR